MAEILRQVPTLLLLLFLSNSCSVSREREPETDLASLRTWVASQATQLTEMTEQEWSNAREDFKVKTNQLDNQQDELSTELKTEYRQLKQRFSELDKEYATQAVRASWRKELLGQYANISKLHAGNLSAAYSNFMSQVRELNKDWSEQVWDLTDAVFAELNAQKASLEGKITTEDEITIKALQMEYSTLELME